MSTLELLLLVAALVLGIVEEFRASGRSLIAWAVICIAVAFLAPHFLNV